MRAWMFGFVLGTLPIALLPRLPGWPVPGALAASGLLLLWRDRRAWRCCAGLALGAALALVQGKMLLAQRLPADCAGRYATVEGRVASLPTITRTGGGPARQRFEFSLESVSPARCRGPAKALISYYGEQAVAAGQRWRFQVRLKRPWGLANPGSFNMQAWFAQSGVHATGTVRAGTARQLPGGDTLRDAHHRMRQRISGRIAALPMEQETGAVLRAVTVADRSGIDSRLWSLLQRFGVSHLLVISGMHVGLVAGAGYLLGGPGCRLLRLTGVDAPWLPGVLALALAAGYAALAGFTVATQRALCMLAAFIAAGLAGRQSGPAGNLLLAAVAVLALNTLAPLGSGFWLSFCAVAALLWLARWQRGGQRARRALSVHLLMSLVMLPLGAWWFGGASLVSAPANFLMVPVVGLFVVPISLLATLCCLTGLPGDALLWRLAGWPLRHALAAARRALEGGGEWLYCHLAPDLPELLLAGLAVALVAVPAGRWLRLLAVVMVVPLLLPPLPEAPGVTVAVLDVGQGTAVAVLAGERALLYDTGGGDPAGANIASSVILPYLRHRGISALDTFIVSHADADHSAGSGTVLRALPVRRLLLGDTAPLPAAGRRCLAGESWRWPGGVSFRILSPADEPALAGNDSSCVLQIRVGDYRLLLPGDIGAERERTLVRHWGDALRSDWLLAGHHGSRTSSSHTFLKTVRPSVAVFSSGYANRFGHPHPAVLRRLRERGVRIFSTSDSGALEFQFSAGRPVAVTAWRELHPRFWM
jgi:competence protein ComEC